MLENIWKKLFRPDEEDGKNNRQNVLMYLSFVVMLGIVLILWSNIKTPRPANQGITNEPDAVPTLSTSTSSNSWEDEMEQKLKRVLSLIDGVGRVEVVLTLEKGKEYLYSYNSSINESQTNEKDTSGGTRTINDSSKTQDIAITRDQNGAERPIEISQIPPSVKGVLVVAEGAEDSKTSSALTRAIQTVFQIDLYRITILPYKR